MCLMFKPGFFHSELCDYRGVSQVRRPMIALKIYSFPIFPFVHPVWPSHMRHRAAIPSALDENPYIWEYGVLANSGSLPERYGLVWHADGREVEAGLSSCGDYQNGFRSTCRSAARSSVPTCNRALSVLLPESIRLVHGLSVMHDPAHFHVTFTLPSPVTRTLFEKGFRCEKYYCCGRRI